MKKVRMFLSMILFLAMLAGMIPTAVAEPEDLVSAPVEEAIEEFDEFELLIPADMPVEEQQGIDITMLAETEDSVQGDNDTLVYDKADMEASRQIMAIQAIPSDATAFNGHKYRIYYEAINWEDAKAACEALGGHLATITSAEEQAFIESLNASSTRLWIGGYRESYNDWKWVTGEKWSYTHWGSGEANDSSNVIANENSVSVWPMYWNDLNNASREQSGYICEWDYAKRTSLCGASVTLSYTKYIYNGKQHKPTVTVKLNGKTLKKDTDYTVTYQNNKNIGTAKVKVTGKNAYKGTDYADFRIVPATPSLTVSNKNACSADLKASSVMGASGYEFRYKKSGENTEHYKRTANRELTLKDLTGGKKYAFRVRAYATVSGKRIYGGYSTTQEVKILKGKDFTKGKLIIANEKAIYVYTGKQIKPTVKVKMGIFTLEKDVDYTLTWSKNINAGTAKVTATGIGKYVGKLEGTFVIGRAPLKSDYFLLEKSTYTYNGSAIEPKVGGVYNKTALVKGTDFTVSYSNNADVGTATVKLKGKGNFTDTVKKTFTIKALSISKCAVSLPDGDTYAYTGSEIKPRVEVKKGDVAIPSTSYTVAYQNNIEPGTAGVLITGTGNISGMMLLSFEITERVVSPVPNGCYFTKQSKDEAKNWVGYHDINVNVSTKTPVYAIANGTVVCSQKYRTINGEKYLTSYGNCINFTSDEIDGKVYTAIYAHLSRFALSGVEQIIPSSNTRQTSGGSSLPLNDGKPIRVKAGDIIGYIGTTGNSTGLHLHFELYENGKRVNPPDMFPELVK